MVEDGVSVELTEEEKREMLRQSDGAYVAFIASRLRSWVSWVSRE